MPTQISGTSGVNKIQDGAVNSAAKLGAAVVSAPALNGGQSGNPPVFGARAWCRFNGTLAGTNPPDAGGNVASVTRNSAGDYTVTFTTPMPDANYAVVPFFRTTTTANLFVSRGRISAPAAGAFRFDIYNSGIAAQDCEEVHLVFYR